MAKARKADKGADPRTAGAGAVPHRPAWRATELGAGPTARERRGGSDTGGGFAETAQETKAVTVHVHGQEVLSEETVHLGAEPESPSELQDPTQTSTLEQSHEETNQSPDQGTPEQQSPHCEEEFQPLQEHEVPVLQEPDLPAERSSGDSEMVAL